MPRFQRTPHSDRDENGERNRKSQTIVARSPQKIAEIAARDQLGRHTPPAFVQPRIKHRHDVGVLAVDHHAGHDVERIQDATVARKVSSNALERKHELTFRALGRGTVHVGVQAHPNLAKHIVRFNKALRYARDLNGSLLTAYAPQIVLLAGAWIGAIWDARTGKIPNRLTFPMIAIGLGLHAATNTPWYGLAGLGLATLLHFPLWDAWRGKRR